MAPTIDTLAFDLGAESGRAILGRFDGDRLNLTEVHRFPNGPVRTPDGLHWDAPSLFEEMKRGLALAVVDCGSLDGIGVDTWGVDFALLDERGELLGLPFHYRDSRTEGVMEKAFERVSREEIFEQTGVQFLPINTLYQLYSMVLSRSPLLERAATFLTIPDLFNYWLSGRTVCEFTNATTTQFHNPRAGAWATPLLEKLGVPTHILPEIVPPGTVLGPLRRSVADDMAAGPAPLIAPACHDTGSAVAAVPAAGESFAYVSSGTWSLVGVEVAAPVITPEALTNNFTNEGGVGGYRFLKNVTGLWLLQECRRSWAAEGDSLSYDGLIALAEESPPFGPLLDPDHALFLNPADMPSAIAAFCSKTGQAIPEEKGAVVRCALESLALKYRWVVERIEEMQARPVDIVHIIGGGARNRLLCRFTADATGKPVAAGPVEATAAGNILVQMLALGHLSSLAEGRELVRRSFPVERYEPRGRAPWDSAFGRFMRLLETTSAASE
jgi:rhamnulokinase